MTIEIKDSNKKTYALLATEAGRVEFLGEADGAFRKFLEEAVKDGITARRDLYDQATKTYKIVEGPIASSDPLFPVALKEFLVRQGYKVSEKHPEMEDEIKKRLAGFPDDNPDKQYLTRRLPEMSHLEQTYLLKELKQYKA